MVQKSQEEIWSEEEETLVQFGLRNTLNSYEGRVFIWELLANCGTFNPQFATNALQTAHNTGMQTIGLTIFNRIMELDPALFYKMQQEMSEKQKTRNSQHESDTQ